MRSLSSRLLILTILFVMLAEILIFVPSIARFRETWLQEKLALGHLAILALDATPDHTVSEMLQKELLDHVGAHALLVGRGGARLMLSADMPPPVVASYDLTDAGMFTLTRSAFATLLATDGRVIRVMGSSPRDPAVVIELVLDETPLRREMVDFGWRILGLSIVISLITATLVYLSLQWLMVRPMRRITDSMITFREDPEDPNRVIVPSTRGDEIGMAQRELASMQARLRDTLRQRAHLAALGTAVAKVNHDLRGILSSALMVSDRLSTVDDPEVRRVTPTLFASIERAVNLCTKTLHFVGQGQPPIERSRFALHSIIADIEGSLAVANDADCKLKNAVSQDLEIEADREQLYRALDNLVRNATEAGARTIAVSAYVNERWIDVEIRDDGPGLAPRAQEKLFQPFEGSARAGGAGLGLAIAREIARGHGGDLKLVATSSAGTLFRISLPMV